MSNSRDFLTKFFADHGGEVSFRDYMAAALYDSNHGYYTKNIVDVGGVRADFSTWATRIPLGTAIAKWTIKELEHHNWNPPFHVIEVGGGDGSMANDFIKSLPWNFRRKLNYQIVEISPVLRELQAKKLKRRKVNWHSKIETALDNTSGNVIIFSNELVDAFPPDWLRWNGESWEEIYIAFSEDSGLRETFKPIDTKLDWVPPTTGQRVELHNGYIDWIEHWSDRVKQGSMLTIDYGDTSLLKIYSRKPDGTMRAYYKQQRLEGPAVYQRFGKQDLTCDVDFSALQHRTEKMGWETISLEKQSAFLNSSAKSTDRDAEDAFLVLHQRKTD